MLSIRALTSDVIPRLKTGVKGVAALAAVGATVSAVLAAEKLPGPIEAHVIEVIDGDTFIARARIWLGQDLTVRVRPRGIDAPELRAACAVERAKGRAARHYLAALIAGKTVHLRAVENDKYAGRIDADVHVGTIDVAARMLASGHAVPYDGKRRADGCAVSSTP